MDPVKLIECPRDAWQGLPRHVPAELKVQYLRELVAAGFAHLDCVSFVSQKAVPQMADSEEVLAQFSPPTDIEIIGIVVNERGAERAIATGAVKTLGFPSSISETFLRRNQNQSKGENIAALRAVKERADAAGLGVVAYISMAFGNPYGDEWSEAEIVKTARCLVELGINTVSLADTVGLADAPLISRVLGSVLRECADCEIGVHMHSTREGAREKVLAAYDAGCRRFDAALGGLGGCPFAQDRMIGNIPTEELVSALKERDVKLNLNLARLFQLNAAIAVGAE